MAELDKLVEELGKLSVLEAVRTGKETGRGMGRFCRSSGCDGCCRCAWLQRRRS